MLVRKAIQKICKGAYHFIYIYIYILEGMAYHLAGSKDKIKGRKERKLKIS